MAETAARSPSPILLKNANVVDATRAEVREGVSVLVDKGRIAEVSEKPIKATSAEAIDLKGKTLMPGLIDSHVHVIAYKASFAACAASPDSLVALHAARLMNAMLMRGFTTVRDCGGADYGLALAVEQGLIAGPRLIICGKGLSQTGGHADFRGRYDSRNADYFTTRLGSFGRVCDGVPDVRRAAREEIKAGACFVKIMANGGVASPTDPIAFYGFSREEILAVVEEAEGAQTYVAAHLYTDDAIRRAVDCGVHSVEHGNLIGPDTARLMAVRKAIAVPTLVTYETLAAEGAAMGFPADSLAKLEDVRGAGLGSLAIFKEAGVRMAYGTDLLGDMQRHQSREFEIRARVLKPIEIIASATTVGAELCGYKDSLGVVKAGAIADLIAIDGNPLKDIKVLGGQGERIPLVMKDGRIFKNALGAMR